MIKKVAFWMSIALIGGVAFGILSGYLIQIGYNAGYREACHDFYNGRLKMDLVEHANGETSWEWISSFSSEHRKRRGGTWPPDGDLKYDHHKRRGCIGQCDNLSGQCKLNAWDDKNYYELKRMGCPKCGSLHITGNVPRDRGVVTAYICLDCGYCWKRK